MGSGCENRKEKGGDTEVLSRTEDRPIQPPNKWFVVELHYQSLQIRSKYSKDLPFSKI